MRKVTRENGAFTLSLDRGDVLTAGRVIVAAPGPRIAPAGRLGYAFFGGALAGVGAKIALGCTSGQALTGGAMLNVGSLVFMLAVFAAAYGLADFVRKEWLGCFR